MKSDDFTCVQWLLPIAASVLLGMAGSPASAEAPALTTALLRKLDERDASILELQERVAELERERAASGGSPKPRTSGQASATHGAPPSVRAGVLQVDEAAAERALERSLTQSGALLLPAGVAELQFSARYDRTEQSTPALLLQDGQISVGSIDSRRNDYTASLSLRVGMPLDSQLELTAPYRSSHQSAVELFDGATSLETRSRVSAAEDVTVGVAKTLHREQNWVPDIIGRLSWNAGNGSATLGGGFNRVRGGLTLLKRLDPLVFTGNLYLETAMERNGVRPGSQTGLSIAALLAASPETSLSAGIDQVVSRRTRVDGVRVPGTDQVSSMLMLGATTVISRHSLLSLSVGIGLTRGAPDYSIGVSVPVRFGLFN